MPCTNNTIITQVLIKLSNSRIPHSISLVDIFVFTTGMPYEPPLGFSPQPSVSFTSTSAYPIANTCGNIIRLPTKHTSLDEFGWHVCFGILNSAGFGKV